MLRSPLKSFILALSLLGVFASAARAQGNYEIQVYGSETVAPRTTMVELHSNYTAVGLRETPDGTQPANHAIHETVEITQGLSDWSEVGFYIFERAQ